MSSQTRVRHALYGLLPTDVDGIDALAELALDLRWSLNHGADEVWHYPIGPTLTQDSLPV